MRVRVIILVLALPFLAWTEDAAFSRLRTLMAAIRADQAPDPMAAKHALRDWVESRLPAGDRRWDPAALATELNAELRQTKLLCEDDGCPERSVRGFLSEIRLEFRRESLILITGMGAKDGCTFDESAYAYQPLNRWQRFWESEQNDYSEGKYYPYKIYSVHLATPAQREDQRDRLVLMLAKHYGCAGNWHSVVYQLWRSNPERATLLLQESQGAYDDGELPIRGSLSGGEALVEYYVVSIDPAFVHHRPEIRHYRIVGDHVERVDPVALNPADFVDHWLNEPWKMASLRSEQVTLERAHRRWHSDHVIGQFVHPTGGDHFDGARTWLCREPDLRQVGVDFGDPAVRQYFLVRWSPPLRFAMVAVNDRPTAGCTAVDRHAEDLRTLFPQQ